MILEARDRNDAAAVSSMASGTMVKLVIERQRCTVGSCEARIQLRWVAQDCQMRVLGENILRVMPRTMQDRRHVAVKSPRREVWDSLR